MDIDDSDVLMFAVSPANKFWTRRRLEFSIDKTSV